MPCITGGSKRMSAEAVAAIVKRQGGPPRGTKASEWVALAMRESSGRYECVNEADAVGLWQIRTLHVNAIPQFQGGSRPLFREWLKKPDNNWSAAKNVYMRQGWGAWSASHRPTAASDRAVKSPSDEQAHAAGAVDPGLSGPLGAISDAASALNPLDDLGDVAGSIVDLAKAIGGFFSWVTDPDTWRRIGLVVVGGGIVLVGVAAIARGTEIGRTIEDAATAAGTKGLVTPAGGTPSGNGSTGGSTKQTRATPKGK